MDAGESSQIQHPHIKPSSPRIPLRSIRATIVIASPSNGVAQQERSGCREYPQFSTHASNRAFPGFHFIQATIVIASPSNHVARQERSGCRESSPIQNTIVKPGIPRIPFHLIRATINTDAYFIMNKPNNNLIIIN
ncbi:hypothetical protein EV690_1256 [Celerinatantimonas diazotrophica]|uniref:Uncharacterized protein n=1 Tax=Celerinatantimonas diazotrophica TaxID=412034 RepID=A0A4R1K565_9GAMM|nr:hypothetical protein EV690_1256 [Celerinatantimonas diazotrophica]CAG9297728.1 hypothetical protein CEDIAZO_02917 [Celerinatantimonas diazotrophica]